MHPSPLNSLLSPPHPASLAALSRASTDCMDAENRRESALHAGGIHRKGGRVRERGREKVRKGFREGEIDRWIDRERERHRQRAMHQKRNALRLPHACGRIVFLMDNRQRGQTKSHAQHAYSQKPCSPTRSFVRCLLHQPSCLPGFPHTHTQRRRSMFKLKRSFVPAWGQIKEK
mmetsp:Transcript_33104/g.65704  ORF Transcript_33104/g.65704 Transcript_33104/m.65704 type:complete len:174 (+) Transcript_33104:529-1050(+)